MNEDEFTIDSGFLTVSDGHKIYYQRWGNPKSKPIFFLHGGPGSGCKDKYKINFDPKKHQVVFHDQRGSGKSTPFASTKNNTTQDLVEDIEKLRKKFDFGRIQLTGGSWGSFLAFAYSINYSENVSKILVSGIFTGNKSELDYIQQGGLKTHYPDAWQQYIEVVPENQRHNTSKFYLNKMLHDKNKMDYVKRWVLLESSALSIDSDFTKDKLGTNDYDENSMALALLEAHYFVNNCFVEDNFIKNNADKLRKIPIVMVHGRYDHVCPPQTAFELAATIGSACHLQLVPASHSNEGSLREAVRAYCWSFLD